MNKYIKTTLKVIEITKTPYKYIWYLGIYTLFASFIEIISLQKLNNFLSNLTSFNQSNNQLNNIIYQAIILILIFFVRMLISVFVNYKIAFRSNYILVRLRNLLLNRILECSRDKIDLSKTSININLLQNSSINVANIYVAQSIKTVSEIVILTLLIIYLFIKDFYIMSITCAFLVIGFLIIQYPIKYISTKAGKSNIIANENTLLSFSNIFLNYKMIRSLGEESFFGNFGKKYIKMYAKSNTIDKTVRSAPRVIFEFFLILGAITSLLFLFNIYDDFGIIIGSVAIVIAGGFRIIPAANIVANFINAFNFNYYAYEKIINLLEQTNDDCEYKNAKTFSKKYLSDLKRKRIFFGEIIDRDNKTLLEEKGFYFNFGEINSIVGPSGSGKTTIAESILGFRGEKYIPSIFLENEILGFQDRKSFISSSSYCPQLPSLFEATFAENISFKSYEDKDFDLVKAEKIVKRLGLTNIQKRLGWDGKMYLNDSFLSGGQLQRLSLARGIYASKKILFLDEITANLDEETELSIINLLKELSKDVMIICITHSNTLIKNSRIAINLEN